METKRKIIIFVSIGFVIAIGFVGVWIFNTITAQQPAPGDSSIADSDNTTSTSQPNDTPQETPTSQNQDQNTMQRTQDDLNSFVIKNNPGLVDTKTGIPIYTIVKKQNPLEGWYILTLRNNDTDTSDADVIIRDVNGQLTTVAGPGTGLYTIPDLPEAVKKALVNRN
ncbi:hypothetical protein EON76_01610 [bacterium]|nr:MAG: hypothetical protein EON76_01610 [bacterium]